MSFGLKNAPGTFRFITDLTIAAVKWQFALVYLDVIVIYSKSSEEHIGHARRVLTILNDAFFTLR